MATSQGIRAGRAFVELYANDNKLVRGLRSAQRKLKAFGASVTGMGLKLAGLASVAAAPLAFAVKASSDMEETMNKFNVVFGENSRAVKEWSDGFARDVGRSKQQVADFMAGSQDLFVPLGFEPGAATEMSKQITGLAVDLASFNNKADADVIRDLHAALTGSGEVMKKYGVLVSEAAVKQELLNTGMDPKTATDQQKVMARLSIIMKGTTAAQGDAVRSADSYANQQKRLWAVTNDLATVIGDNYRPVLAEVYKYIGDIITVSSTWIKENQGLFKTIGIIVAAVGATGVVLLSMGAAISVVTFALGGLSTVFSVVIGILGLVASPVGIIVTALALLVTWLMKSGVAVEWLGSTFGPLFDHFAEAMAAIKLALTNGDIAAAAGVAWAALELAWVKGTNMIKEIWNAALLKMKKAWSEIVGGISNVILKVTGNSDAIAENNAITNQRNSSFDAENKLANAAADERLRKAEEAYKNAKLSAIPGPQSESSTVEEMRRNLGNLSVESGEAGGAVAKAKTGQVSTQNGLRSIIEAVNKSGQDKTIDEIRNSNTLLAEAVDLLRKPRLRTTEAS